MSTLDQIISGVQVAKDKLNQGKTSVDGLAASSEAVSDVGHSVGSDRLVNGGTEMGEGSERALALLQAVDDKFDSIVARSEALKTAGPNVAPPSSSSTTGSGSSANSPQYEVRTGADHRPNPIHATPAHTREPSRKIGDPVKPVELEVPASNRPRRRRASREFVNGAEDLGAYGQELADSSAVFSDNFDPWGPEVKTETHTTPTMQQPQPATDLDSPDVVGTVAALAAVVIEGVSRWKTRKKGE